MIMASLAWFFNLYHFLDTSAKLTQSQRALKMRHPLSFCHAGENRHPGRRAGAASCLAYLRTVLASAINFNFPYEAC